MSAILAGPITWRLTFPPPAAYICLTCRESFEDPDQHDFELCRGACDPPRAG
jgi:hypothetical protein